MVSYFQINNIKNLRNYKNNNNKINKILTHNKLMYGTSRNLENENSEYFFPTFALIFFIKKQLVKK